MKNIDIYFHSSEIINNYESLCSERLTDRQATTETAELRNLKFSGKNPCTYYNRKSKASVRLEIFLLTDRNHFRHMNKLVAVAYSTLNYEPLFFIYTFYILILSIYPLNTWRT